MAGHYAPRSKLTMSAKSQAAKQRAAEATKRWRKANPLKAKASAQRWRAKNPDYYNQYQREWRVRNPERQRASRVKYDTPARTREYNLRRYDGLTTEAYEALLAAQGGVCAICKKPPQKRRLCVDHDHISKVNRGLLCNRCNSALERVENDPEWGVKALNYLALYIEQLVDEE